jgi:hypothetical protein
MINPRKPGLLSRIRGSSGWGRALLTAALLLAGGFAWARGEKVWAPWDPVPEVAAPPPLDVPIEVKPTDRRAGGRAVCVRLCDGFFFPSATNTGGDEACAAQCPDAPAARYTEPVGSDKIEESVSTRGEPYTALPVANRYRTTLDNACTCHRASVRDYTASLLNDPTLRKGDVVMTAKGFVVFEGAKARLVTSSDFVTLSRARSLPKDVQATLLDMERAGASQRQVDPYASPSQPQEQASNRSALAGSAK